MYLSWITFWSWSWFGSRIRHQICCLWVEWGSALASDRSRLGLRMSLQLINNSYEITWIHHWGKWIIMFNCHFSVIIRGQSVGCYTIKITGQTLKKTICTEQYSFIFWHITFWKHNVNKFFSWSLPNQPIFVCWCSQYKNSEHMQCYVEWLIG